MNEKHWRAERDDRTLRYAGRVLDPDRRILLHADPYSAVRYDGQVAILTCTNLLGRMTPAVSLDIPDVPLIAPLPWAGRNLRDFVWDRLHETDPFGHFEFRSYRPGDYVINFGPSRARTVVHGSGWNAYLGPAPSPVPVTDDHNPIGPALAAIIAVAELFGHNFAPPVRSILINALTWSHELSDSDISDLSLRLDPGELWTVGAGSVGTAVLYFLTLATTRFSAALFDMDRVRRWNLDRSPVFIEEHVGNLKVLATQDYLQSVGVTDITAEPCALDQSSLWFERQKGRPDVLISAANERNVRHVIETGYPPIQIYGTTGQNWQSSVIRHIPLEDPCSCCLFPDTTHAPTECATGKVAAQGGQKQIDAALPFLSFAAGAMAAAEILKLGLPDFPFSSNRVILNTHTSPRLVHAPLPHRRGCVCQRLDSNVHRQMLEGGRFAALSRE